MLAASSSQRLEPPSSSVIPTAPATRTFVEVLGPVVVPPADAAPSEPAATAAACGRIMRSAIMSDNSTYQEQAVDVAAAAAAGSIMRIALMSDNSAVREDSVDAPPQVQQYTSHLAVDTPAAASGHRVSGHCCMSDSSAVREEFVDTPEQLQQYTSCLAVDPPPAAAAGNRLAAHWFHDVDRERQIPVSSLDLFQAAVGARDARALADESPGWAYVAQPNNLWCRRLGEPQVPYSPIDESVESQPRHLVQTPVFSRGASLGEVAGVPGTIRFSQGHRNEPFRDARV